MILRTLKAIARFPAAVGFWTRMACDDIRKRHGDRAADNPLSWVLALIVGVLTAGYGVWIEITGKPRAFSCARCTQTRPWPPTFVEHTHENGRCEHRPMCGPCWSLKVRHAGTPIPAEIAAMVEADEARARELAG